MMNDHFARPREGVTIPRFWVTLALSVLLHVAVFWKVHTPLTHMTIDEPEQGKNSGSLAVRLAPSPAPHAAPPEPPPEAAPKVIARPPRPSRTAPPPVLAVNKPPVAPVQTPAPAPAPPAETVAPPKPPAAGDLAAFIEARRRAREAPAQPSPGMIASAPAETEAERARRITAANLQPKQQVFGYDPAAGGGVFQIRRMSLNDAEFVFYGWNRDIRRKTMQIIEVSKGGNPDIKIAVVRRMIAIIRDDVKDEFNWESNRLGRNMLLSARPRDNAYLEEFMMREFFPDSVVAR